MNRKLQVAQVVIWAIALAFGLAGQLRIIPPDIGHYVLIGLCLGIAALEKKTATNLALIVGIVLQIMGRVLCPPFFGSISESLALLGLAIFMTGSGQFLWGCYNFSQRKARPGYLGLSVGLVWCLLILFVPALFSLAWGQGLWPVGCLC